MIALVPLLVLAVPVLLLACAVPIYTDEIVWKILQARYFLDHGLVNNGFPQCGPSFLVPPPLTHLPARVLDAWLYQDLSHPLKLRVLGVLAALALGALAFLLIRGVVRPVPSRTTTLAIILAFWGIGLVPLLSVLNRPEGPILLGVVGLALAAIVMRRATPPRLLRRPTTRLVLFLLVVVVLLGTHPKTLFLVPVFLVAGFFLLPSWTHRVVALVVVLTTCAQTVAFGDQRYHCPNDPWTANKLAEVTLKLSDAWQRPNVFARQAWQNLRSTPKYFEHVVLRGFYMAGWLPDHPRIAEVDDLGARTIYAQVVLVGLGVVVVLAGTLGSLVRARRLSEAHALLLALAPTLVAQVAYQSYKQAYDAEFLLILGGVAIVLGWPADAARRWRRPLQMLFALFTLTTLCNEGRLLYHFGHFATHEWLAGGNLAGNYEGTISGFHYDRVNAQVLAAARACDIDVATHPQFVLTDDLTYPALGRTATYPLHTMGVYWWGQGIPDLYQFLKALKSEGMVVRCRSIPPELQAKARKQADGLCCLPRFPS